jgi:predicted site-specific integrase-resolvase
MKLSTYAKQLGISYSTAWRMWKRGEIAGYQLVSGTVIVNQPEQESHVTRKVAIYARVSNSENKKNLDTQAERLVAWCTMQGWSGAQVVKECGSGVNDQRPRFLALLADPSITHIVVEHQDRASRFGVAYIQTLLAVQQRELVVVNSAQTAEEDLMSDLVSIITSFVAQLYDRRRAKRKTDQVLAALQENGSNGEEDPPTTT